MIIKEWPSLTAAERGILNHNSGEGWVVARPKISSSLHPKISEMALMADLRQFANRRRSTAMRRGGKSRLIVLIAPGVLLLAGWLFTGQWTAPAPEQSNAVRMVVVASQIRVVDGDTIEVHGRKYRLTGYDTPETDMSKCSSEKALGDRATRRLRQLIDQAGSVRLETELGRDRYGRRLGQLWIDGQDAGRLLVNEGLARQYRGGQRQSWC